MCKSVTAGTQLRYLHESDVLNCRYRNCRAHRSGRHEIMDLGLKGKRAIVCASSKGLGRSCALTLAREGVGVVVNGRNKEALDRTAAEVEAVGNLIAAVGADVTTQAGRERLLAACPDPDILITNTAGPPLGDFRDWDAEIWQEALNDLMISPIMLMRSVLDKMIERRFGRIINITSVSVKMPAPDRGLTNGAKTGLTGFMAGLAQQTAVHNVTINNVLPGFFATDRGRQSLQQRAERAGVDPTEFRDQFLQKVPARRLGEPDEFGALCAYICSRQNSFMTGQNISLDGGLFNSTI